MSKKPRISKQKAISEIVKGFLRKGMATEDILVLIALNGTSRRTTFYRYLEEAKQEHTKEQQEVQRVST